jgi:uncharacterized protein (TIGR02145 family)
MKHLLTLTLLCFGLLAQAQIPAYVPTNGLVGWWPFNGNANDESGNGNHGTVNGATLAADRFGNAGKAYSFDGNSKVSVQNSNSLQVGNELTYSIWFKQSTMGNVINYILQKGTGGGCSTTGYYIGIDYGFGTVPNGAKGLAYGINSANCGAIGSDTLINPTTWHSMIIVYSPPIGNKIYIDGKLTNGNYSACNTCAIVNSNNPLLIGAGSNSGPSTNDKSWNGLLDDIAIYNRALSAAEVQQLYLGNSGNSASVTTVPGKINYQGVAVGANGKPIKNGSVGLRLSVLDSTLNGGVLYSETKTVNTDASGLFATHVGGGTVTAGTFANIPWANGNDKFLKVEMDAQGGSNYQNMGTTQLVSVPYALHAGTAQSANTLRDSSGNAYQISMVNGQPTLVAVPGSSSASNPGSFACGQSVTYAGESYPTVQIGTQCWFQKNLNVGSMIQGANDQTNNSILEKYCYNNDTANCSIYGGLYQWAEAVQYQNGASNTTSPSPAFSGNVKGMCPTGWHVPSDGEWCTLTTFLDSTVDCSATGWSGTDAGGKMKSTSNLWNSPNTGATNSSGFSALPGGLRNTNGLFNNILNEAYFFSSSNFSSTLSYYRNLRAIENKIFQLQNYNWFGFTVRCLKD